MCGKAGAPLKSEPPPLPCGKVGRAGTIKLVEGELFLRQQAPPYSGHTFKLDEFEAVIVHSNSERVD